VAKATPQKKNGLEQPIRKAPTFDRLKSKKGLVRKIPVYLDGETLEEWEQAKIEVDLLGNPSVAQRLTDEQKQKAHDRLDQAKVALDETTEWVTLRSPHITTDEDPPRQLKGRLAYEWLISQHPASEEDNAKHKEEHGVDAPYDADTFAPAIVAACADGDLTVEQWDDLFSEWSFSEVMNVFTTAMEVCNASQVGDLGKGFGAMLGSTRN
jgi:hypothetical protein